jgi:hypothetical protein
MKFSFVVVFLVTSFLARSLALNKTELIYPGTVDLASFLTSKEQNKIV